MQRASSTLLSGGRVHRGILQLSARPRPCTHAGRPADRPLSFKAFAQRKIDGAKGPPKPEPVKQKKGQGGFAGLFDKKNAAAEQTAGSGNRSAIHRKERPSWRSGGANGPPAERTPRAPGNAARSNRPQSQDPNRPRYGNRGSGDRRQQYTPNNRPPQTKPGEDLRDISQLRNAFMKDRPNKPRESWRTGGRSGGHATNAPTRPPPQQPTPSLAEGAGVGTKFTPSFYKKKAPPAPPPPSPAPHTPGRMPTSGGIPRLQKKAPGHSPLGTTGPSDDVKPLEDVMKANAAQRQKAMEQRYLNAGERLPWNADEHGRAQRGGAGRYLWRNRANNAANYQRGGERGQRGRMRNWPPTVSPQQHQKGNERSRFHDPLWERKAIRKRLPAKMPKSMAVPHEPVTLVDLAQLIRVNKRTIVRTLRSLGESVAYSSANQDSYKIDPETVEYIFVELGIEAVKEEKQLSSVEEAERRAMRQGREELDEEAKTEEEERYAQLPPRSPVVSIMGHVDHGKTTLMDALRRRAVTGEATPKGAGKGKAKKKKKGKETKRGKGGVSITDENVAGTEAGGITQVITAFEVPLPLEEGAEDDEQSPISTVTFLDTPGHAAFKKMRQSGSSATDVIVLVVAADDGVSPQTVEIIDMYKSIARSQPQSISLVIAVSKIDKPGIDVDESVMRIENQLMEHEIYTENVLAGGGEEGEFGACQLFPLSGITGDGLDDLVEGLALQSEMMDLRADEEAKGEGIVIDARMEKGLGVVADCVIRWGSIAKGDFVVSGTNGGRVKFLNDVGNKPLKKGMPSQPVRIVGFKSLPKAGDPVICAASEDEAKELIQLRESELMNEYRAEYETEAELQVVGTAAKNNLMMQKEFEKYEMDGEASDETIRIPVVIKADSHGALDAVRDALVSIGEESSLNIIVDPVEMSTGVVTSSDVLMARESEAGIFVFGKAGIADKQTKQMAEDDDVSIRSYDVIYRLLEDAKEFFGKYLPVELAEKVHGKARVQAVFDVTDANKKAVSIAGLQVSEGNLFKEKSIPGKEGGDPLPCFYRVLRKGEAITDVDKKIKASSLRKVKDDADSVRHGEECGLGLAGFNNMEDGDIIECYSIEERRAVI